MSPNTLGALRRLRNTDGNCLLELLSGPLGLPAYGQPESAPGQCFRESQGTRPFNGSLWGAEIAATTHIADGDAAVISITGGGGLVCIRPGLEVFYNLGYGDTLFQNNLVAWRVARGERSTYPAERCVPGFGTPDFISAAMFFTEDSDGPRRIRPTRWCS